MPDRETPSLEPKAFHILVSLAGGASHGYAIRQEVDARTAGAIRLWPATLYGLLSELAALGLIEDAAAPAGPGDDPRRRYYALTPAGRRRLADEAARMASLARLARTRLGRRTS